MIEYSNGAVPPVAVTVIEPFAEPQLVGSLEVTFVTEGEGMGEVKGISDIKEEISSDEEWFGTDEVVEEEE